MMLRPVGKRILIKPVEVKVGGLVYVSKSALKPSQFTVEAIGDDVTKVNTGDVIYLDKHFGVEIQHGGETFLIIDEGTILAKVVD